MDFKKTRRSVHEASIVGGVIALLLNAVVGARLLLEVFTVGHIVSTNLASSVFSWSLFPLAFIVIGWMSNRDQNRDNCAQKDRGESLAYKLATSGKMATPRQSLIVISSYHAGSSKHITPWWCILLLLCLPLLFMASFPGTLAGIRVFPLSCWCLLFCIAVIHLGVHLVRNHRWGEI